MRSRPKLEVYLSPARPMPGGELLVDAALQSRSETPIDGIVFELEGIETRYTHTSYANNVSSSHQARHVHLSLVAQSPAQTLGVGEHRVRASFALPAELPPAFESRYGAVRYTLRVRIDIPWWPDRQEQYVVPMQLRPSSVPRSPPARFATSTQGPQGKELYIEASLDSTTVELGGSLDGAVSLQNVEFSRVRRVDIAFCAVDHALVDSSTDRAGIGSWLLVLHEGIPVEGTAMRFSTRLPAHVSPSFRGRLLELLWHLEIRAVVAWGTDVVLRAPLQVVVPPSEGPASRRQPRVPPIGHERRTLLWAEVARKTGMVHDREEERLTLDVAPAGAPDGRGVALAICLEHRGAAGLHYVASITWPNIGLDVQIAERRWVDSLRREIDLDDGAFKKRVIVRGREAAQVMALLDRALRALLIDFERIALDDEGCELASPGGTESASDLDSFAWRAIETARLLASSVAGLPPPAAMASCAAAWKDFAREHNGRFFAGDIRIEEAVYGGRPLSISTHWSEDGIVEETAVRLVLGTPLDAELGADAAAARLSAGSRARLDGVRGQVRALRLGPDVLEAVIAGPLADPRAAEPILAALLEVSRDLSGAGEQGPYR